MDSEKHETPWIKRVEELIRLLEGSSIGELELTEAGTEIIIRRRPDTMMVSVPVQVNLVPSGLQVISGNGVRQVQEDPSLPILAPTTGVYYSAPSPNEPAFVHPGDIVHVGQVIALIEAMKVFNEIQAEVSGRVVELVAINGEVVHKEDVLIKIEPL